MLFQDRASISGTHRTNDGYLAAESRISRLGIQIYAGHEVGRPDLPTVRVYRGEDAVFAADAMASAAHKPITLDHPAHGVTAERWKELAVGWTGDAVVRDGEFLRVPMMVADASAIRAIESGTRELSCGYSAELEFGNFVTPDGPADARQKGVRLNHVAVVAKGKAGAAVRFGDSAAPIDNRDQVDAVHDAKAAGGPATIDEALRLKFAELAKGQGTSVADMLAHMDQGKIEETAAEVARAFVSAQAGKGVATMYGDSASVALLAKSAASAMRRDALLGGAISSGREARDAAHAAQFGDAVQVAPRSAAQDRESLAAAASVRDLARAAQY
jgi:hypothetical protein